jgi:hypothetical protein
VQKAQKHCTRFLAKVEIPSSQAQPCPACLKGKMASWPFLLAKLCATHPFQYIHSNLKEYSIQLYHKNKWYISMHDEHSSFAKVYFLKRKSEALERIKDFFAKAV